MFFLISFKKTYNLKEFHFCINFDCLASAVQILIDFIGFRKNGLIIFSGLLSILFRLLFISVFFALNCIYSRLCLHSIFSTTLRFCELIRHLSSLARSFHSLLHDI